MSLKGTYTDTNNPTFTIETFKMLIPQFSKYVQSVEGEKTYQYFEKLANKKILYSVFGVDWELAMSLYIAHELSEITRLSQLPSDDLSEVASSVNIRGVTNNESVGGVYASYGYGQTTVDKPNAKYFNTTQYGQRLMTLYQSKGIPCILVATPD